jgi:hypothetical protein
MRRDGLLWCVMYVGVTTKPGSRRARMRAAWESAAARHVGPGIAEAAGLSSKLRFGSTLALLPSVIEQRGVVPM